MPHAEHTTPPLALSPHQLHRTPCPVGDRLFLCGDLSTHRNAAARQLETWVDLGVQGIIDCRGEWIDADLVKEFAPEVTYVHAGTHDDGGIQPDSWFERGVTGARQVLAADPDARVMVHCHMGINRGPSMGLALLLNLGWDPIEALTAIRTARPIAAIAYAEDAIRWHLNRIGANPAGIAAGKWRVQRWMEDNGIDAARAIRRIRSAD